MIQILLIIYFTMNLAIVFDSVIWVLKNTRSRGLRVWTVNILAFVFLLFLGLPVYIIAHAKYYYDL